MFNRKGTWTGWVLIIGVLSMSGVASAQAWHSTVSWKGLDWDIRGASTTATVNANGELDVFVKSNETSQKPDNWNVRAWLPSDLVQANKPWVEFTFRDTGGGTTGGPRAYLDTWFIDSSQENQETLFQGGIYDGYASYFTSASTYTASTGFDTVWGYPADSRSAGSEHTFKVGMYANGSVDVLFNDTFIQGFGPDPKFEFFESAFLGINTNDETNGLTGTYTDFKWGTNYGDLNTISHDINNPNTVHDLGSADMTITNGTASTSFDARVSELAKDSIEADVDAIRQSTHHFVHAIEVDVNGTLDGAELVLTFDLAEINVDHTLVDSGDDIQLWHYNGTIWEDVTDIASFVDGPTGSISTIGMTGFSPIAVTSIPEPTSLALLGLGSLAMLRRRR